jgi:hypothetical protein
MALFGIPVSCNLYSIFCLFTVSKACLKSMYKLCNSVFYLWLSSKIRRMANILSVVLLWFLNPFWYSPINSSAYSNWN